MHVDSLSIAHRFRGPPRSGNGGYVCGRIADRLPGTVSVRLKAPPPLDTPLRLESADDAARLLDAGDALIGEARSATLDLRPPAPPTYDEAVAASSGFLGFREHPFPRCFVCGPDRETGDGLRILPGAIGSDGVVAAPWLPDASLAGADGTVQREFLWAALDCTSGFSQLPLPEGLSMVLGELCATIDGTLRPGERCVVIGWPLAHEGRKRTAGSAVYGGDGRLVAHARAVWIEVPLADWR
ncbi:MAG: hypothetical protein EOO24_13285 [Comamonadaceae bacterium]|nr:MAG: hypothetical protein EOO24_13285 [Comamonadaceae bacterium]